jgi:hypothetical protein
LAQNTPDAKNLDFKKEAVHSRNFLDFLTYLSLSNKFTYLAYNISYQKISEINVKAEFCDFHFHGKFCSEKPQRHLYCKRTLIKKSFLLGNEEW